jgi:hypothetical protein
MWNEYGKYGRKASRILIRYGQYGRKASWILKRYEKYGRKVGWIISTSFHYSIYFSSVFSISFHSSTYFSSGTPVGHAQWHILYYYYSKEDKSAGMHFRACTEHTSGYDFWSGILTVTWLTSLPVATHRTPQMWLELYSYTT